MAKKGVYNDPFASKLVEIKNYRRGDKVVLIDLRFPFDLKPFSQTEFLCKNSPITKKFL